MMRRIVGCLVISLCGVVAARAVPAQQPDTPSPHIKFDALEVNLGDVVRGQDAVATYTFHNTGNAPLHITAKPG